MLVISFFFVYNNNVIYMKTKVINYDKLKEEDITDKVTRVKALMLNSKKEILLATAYTTIQFPGGHLESPETLNEALKREIMEETGIILNKEYEPFFCLKYMVKDYPKKGNNRLLEIYYFYLFTDEPYNLANTHFDEQENEGGFTLKYVPFKGLQKYLKKNIGDLEINKVVTHEMLLALKEFKRIFK